MQKTYTTLTSDVADVIVSTGNLKAQADALAVSTGVIKAQADALASSTGTLRADLTAEANTRSAADNAIAVSTAAQALLLSGLQGEATNYFRRNGALNTTGPVTFASSATVTSAMGIAGTLSLGNFSNTATLASFSGAGLAIKAPNAKNLTLGNLSGSDWVTISSNGYVVLGVNSTPAQGKKLYVVGDSWLSGNLAVDGNLTTPLTAKSSATFQDSEFSVGGSALTVSGGKVGIGAAPYSTYKLTVGGNILMTGAYSLYTDYVNSASGGATGITISGLIKVSTLTAISGYPSVAFSTPVLITASMGNGLQLKTPSGVSTIRLYQETTSGYGDVFVETGGSPSARISGGVNSYIARYATNFGVGITNPTEKLDVAGNIKAAYGVIAATGTFSGNVSLDGTLTAKSSATFQDSEFSVGGSIFAVSGGKVGIGATPTLTPKLQITGDFTASGVGSFTKFEDRNSATYFLDPNASVSMVVAGKIGIGNTSPSERIDVVGNIKASYGIIADTGTIAGGLTVGSETVTGNFGVLGNFDTANTFSSSVTFQNSEFSVGGSTFAVSAGRIGIGTGTPHSALTVAGPVATAYRAVTSAYTATAEDSIIECDAGGASFTVTLPSAADCAGRVYTVKKTDTANTVTVACAGAETIDGAATYALASQYEFVEVYSNGSVWRIKGKN